MRIVRTDTGTIAAQLEIGKDADHRKRVQISTGCTTRKEARKVIETIKLQTIEDLARAGKLSSALIRKLAVGRMSVATAIQEWEPWLSANSGSDRTVKSHVEYVRKWEQQAAPSFLGDVTEKSLSNWVNQKDGLRLGTKQVRLAALRSFFLFCSARDYISPNPIATVRIKKKLLSHEQREYYERAVFSEHDLHKILDHILSEIAELSRQGDLSPAKEKRLRWLSFWHSATQIGRYSGLRLGDIATLEWASFSKAGSLVVWTEKRDSRVQIPIVGSLELAVDELPPKSGKYVFPEQAEFHMAINRRSALPVGFGRLITAAGLGNKGLSFHSLRHTLATELHLEGETIEAIAEALGHRSVKTTQNYVHKPRS